jgi:glycosyltransferase involved in cell wall biosynthesis
MIAIITPVYNRAHLLEETAASVLAQTSPNWEWHLVDDGSTDNSWQVMQVLATKDKRIKVHQRHRLPKNANTCRNIGVENSDAELLMFLDSDDVLTPTCIEERLKIVSDHSTHNFWLFGHDFMEPNPSYVRKNYQTTHEILVDLLQFTWPFAITGLLIRKELFYQLGALDETLNRFQDPDLYIRLYAHAASNGYIASHIIDSIIRNTGAEVDKNSKDYRLKYILSLALFIKKHTGLLINQPAYYKLFKNGIYKLMQYQVMNVPSEWTKNDTNYWTTLAEWSLTKADKHRVQWFKWIYLNVPTRLKVILVKRISKVFKVV